jgi:hypothetical protein
MIESQGNERGVFHAAPDDRGRTACAAKHRATFRSRFSVDRLLIFQ